MKFLFALALSMAGGFAIAEPLPVEPFPGITPSTTCPDVRAGVMTRPQPVYPRGAIIAGQTGWVIMSFDVLDDGSTSNIRVLAASPSGVYEASVASAIAQWTYQPHMGRVECRLDVRFNLPQVQRVSLEDLASNPAKYHGAPVELDAYATRGFENDTLCASAPNGRPCIWLVWADPPWDTEADFERLGKADAGWRALHLKRVHVLGTFNMNNKGNQETFPGALEHIGVVSEIRK